MCSTAAPPAVVRTFYPEVATLAVDASDPRLSVEYRPLTLANLWRYAARQEKFGILGLWLVLTAACVGLGLLSVSAHWSGLPLNFGGVAIYVTVYPPLVICMLLCLCLGWWWGAVPAYLATLVLALYAGMPWFAAVVFAFTDPLGFAVMVIGYRAIPADRGLRRWGDWLFFVQMSFVSSVFSSSGALIWCYTNPIDSTGVLPIWQGWWLGGFLQNVLIVAPMLALCWPAVERWQGERPALLKTLGGSRRQLVLGLLAVVCLGVVGYGYATIHLATGHAALAVADGGPLLRHATSVLQQTMWVLFWVFAAIVVSFAVLGYEMYLHWQRANELLLDQLQRTNHDLETLANTDGMTGLLNRRAADACLDREWRRARRSALAAALVMMDIDHFKLINDRYGHPAGDAVIRHLADAIRSVMRGTDAAARFGGEEFLIIMPDTDAAGALVFAERLRLQVGAQSVAYGDCLLHYTVSLGVADIATDDATYGQWLRRADQALLAAKAAGRNQTVVAQRSADAPHAEPAEAPARPSALPAADAKSPLQPESDAGVW